jgi:hypothetical protein
MKTWKLIVCLLSLMLFVLAGTTACQQSGEPKKMELRGSIQKETDGDGLYVRSGGKRYHIESQQDLTEMVNKIVTIHGSVSANAGKYSVAVESVTEK